MTDNRINGTRFQDVLRGTGADDLIRGRGANDVLRGRRGDDDLRGDGGDDRLFGGAGDERLIGGRGDDVIFGGAGADLMIWNNGDGSDRLRGGGGNDEARIVANGAGADVFEIASAGRGVALQRTGDGAFALDIRGTETVRLRTGGGDDAVDAGALAAGATRLIVDAGGGDDEVVGSQGDDVVRGGGGNDLVIGGRGDDDLFGGAGDDVFVWNNGDGSDLMRGGRGLDTVVVNGAQDAGNLFAVTEGEAGVLFERTNLGPFQLDLRGVETLRVNGGEEADEIDASALGADAVALQLFGGGGDDALLGGAGDDLLVGGTGADLMDGGGGDDRLVWDNGDGSDVMIGGEGEDVAVVNGADGAGDEFTVADGENGVLFNRVNLGLFELDIREVETLEVNGGGGDDSFDATALSAGLIDVVFNGGAGDDVFLGGDGDDRIIHDADGGADRFEGGDGFDVAVVDAVFEEGVDLRLQSREGGVVVREQNNEAGFSLVALKTERLEVNLGDGDDFVAGGLLGNGKVGLVVIDGGGGDDELRGGKGRDELIGGAGDDILRGDASADVFVFGQGADVVEDFEDGLDLLRTETGIGFEALTISQDGEDALIALADGATLRLLNVDADDVSQADFVL